MIALTHGQLQFAPIPKFQLDIRKSEKTAAADPLSIHKTGMEGCRFAPLSFRARKCTTMVFHLFRKTIGTRGREQFVRIDLTARTC